MSVVPNASNCITTTAHLLYLTKFFINSRLICSLVSIYTQQELPALQVHASPAQRIFIYQYQLPNVFEVKGYSRNSGEKRQASSTSASASLMNLRTFSSSSSTAIEWPKKLCAESVNQSRQSWHKVWRVSRSLLSSSYVNGEPAKLLGSSYFLWHPLFICFG